MSSDLRELYQSVILDHNKHPRNQGSPPTRTATRWATTRCAATGSPCT
jgi:nitrogen fixation NifU-like protein